MLLARDRDRNDKKKDLFLALASYELWSFLAWQDIRLRYRRSKIGPLWITLSMAIFCLALGVVYSKLFKMPISEYLPFLSISFVAWGFISSLWGEFPNLFVDNAAYIKDIQTNLLTILLRSVARNVLIFAHNALIIAGVYVYFGMTPSWVILLAIPGLLLVILNLSALGVILGIVGARFRDVAPINQSIIQIIFFITPITWLPHLVGKDSWIVKANPFLYFLELIRSPLMGSAPEASAWIFSAVSFLVIGSIAALMYVFKSSRIPYWV